IVASRSAEKLKTAQSKLGGKVAGYTLDFRDVNALDEFFQEVGPLDHLIVTAGDGAMGPFGTLSTEVARTAFDSKFWGQYAAVKSALPYLNKAGSVTLTSGVYGLRPPKGASALAAINSAVEGLTRGLAAELAPIRVNVVSPGLVDTPIYSGMDEASRQGMFQAVADSLLLGHVAQPEEIAAAYVYLATNTFTTGATLQIEGGALLS
ncbi:MAG: SDR family oxidoreductase, partial [Firmicutes bacterium]|nr:SDR family oxidoreductase [Bacillota bacterium]